MEVNVLHCWVVSLGFRFRVLGSGLRLDRWHGCCLPKQARAFTADDFMEAEVVLFYYSSSQDPKP